MRQVDYNKMTIRIGDLMKKFIPFIALLLITSACDSPRSTRALVSSKSGDYSSNPINGNPVAGNTVGVDLTNTTTTNTETSVSNIPTDARHCKFSTDGIDGFESTSSHLGAYTLCQSSTDKAVFYVQFKTPPVGSSGDVSVCFIPHTTSGSNSIYVGNPMCGTFPDPKSVKKISFVKYDQYTSALINSVMFFKDTSYYYPSPYNSTQMTLNAYKVCMSQLSYGITSYCTAYKKVGQYIMKSF